MSQTSANGNGREANTESWWAKQLLDSVLAGGGPAVSGGRTDVRHGRVHHLRIEPGSVRALVHGSGQASYRVEIDYPTFDGPSQQIARKVMAGMPLAVSSLLSGTAPRSLFTALERAGVSLVPDGAQLRRSCECGQWYTTCRHAVATLIVLAEQLERAPIDLFTLRGMDVEDLPGLGADSEPAPGKPEQEEQPVDFYAVRRDLPELDLDGRTTLDLLDHSLATPSGQSIAFWLEPFYRELTAGRSDEAGANAGAGTGGPDSAEASEPAQAEPAD